MVGVNAFRVDDDELTEIHRPDPAAERRQRERLADDRRAPRRRRRRGARCRLSSAPQPRTAT